jgi:DNA-binding response OmpR family regulator
MRRVLVARHLAPLAERGGGILGRDEFRLLVASSNAEALEVHRAERVHLILTALDMPGMTGDRLCVLLRRDPALAQVSVILVGGGDPRDRTRSELAGANVFLAPPVDPARLDEAVRGLLRVSARQSYRVLVSVQARAWQKGQPFLATLVNLSATGMLLETGKELARGDEISCSFFLPHGEMVRVDGTVVRVAVMAAGFRGYGVVFRRPDPQVQGAIDGFVKSKHGGDAAAP